MVEGVRRRVVGLASDGLAAVPFAELPIGLRRYVKFTPSRRMKHAANALAAALEAEPAFRSRIADLLRAAQPELVAALEEGAPPAAADPLDVAAAAYLLRTPGWERLVNETGERVERAEAEGAAVEANRLVEKLHAEIAALRSAHRSDQDRARAETDAARKEIESLHRRLRRLEADTRRAEAAARRAVADLEAVRAAAAAERSTADAEARRLRNRLADAEASVEAARRAAREGRSVEDMRLRLLLDTVQQAAAGLQRELGLPPSTMRPADTVDAVAPASASPHDVARRALAGDDPELLDQLLALPQAHLVVDGYNVTKTGYPQIPLEKQRLRLLGGLSHLASQSGAEVTCVFDGKDLDVPVLLAPPRGVRVLFSRSGETADELIRRLVRAEPAGRAVTVVSSDREVADGVQRAGARPVPSTMLLKRLARG
ncbi:NYN domain-containing protein [Phaeacidiphilus oryzae]|uniref:NYN domain-containing protein n=1 Tax=Phaeacidiphilus oryzae TaxID=348818 RepID=UPI000565F209|nr:NYN domain-containing protein [Phaeacidiphilus oryzae]